MKCASNMVVVTTRVVGYYDCVPVFESMSWLTGICDEEAEIL